jgi:hypothetical protein
MRAEWFDPVGRILLKARNMPLRPIFFILGQPDVHDVSGDGIFDEDHFSVHPGQRLSFCRITLYQDIGQDDVLVSFSHGVKIA